MAERNISYEEASKTVPSSYRSYADIAKSSTRSSLININQPHRTPSIPTTSHKKTVFVTRKQRPVLSPGYDKQAHQDILNEFNMPESQNGCALNNSSTIDTGTSNLNTLLLTLLVDIISKNELTLTDHVATKLISILNRHNGPTQVSSVEC